MRFLVGLTALTLALAGCGADDSATESSLPVAADSPEHIHGLGVNPADNAIFVATHTGLWRAGAEEARLKRVGTSRQDVMGFTVAGPDRFLGSGHPSPSQRELPPLLGLIESRDSGRSWKSISLLGEADFHALRHRGDRVYGFDATSGQLLTSADGGRSWRRRSPPGPLLDLAIDPDEPDTLVAAAEDGLFRSSDGGRSWRPLGAAVGLVAWTDHDGLFLIDGAGSVHRSGDGGASFDRVGEIGGQPAALSSFGDELVVALHDSSVKRSMDGGRSWLLRARP